MGNDKPIGIVLPSWNPNEPRFIKEHTDENMIGSDRVFKNGDYVYNQRLGFAYSVDEIVEVLNNQGEALDKEKIIRRKYLDLEKGFSDDKVFSKEEVMGLLECIANELDVDL